jgi:hypothetical protein
MASMASLSFAASELTVGDGLPELRGQYLSGRNATLPNDSSGRVALLMFGFTYQSRFAVEAWTKRFRQDFEKNPQVTFYEIPMIGGIARLGKWFIDSGMRRGTPKADREHVITVYGNTEFWKQRLGVRAEDAAYLVIVDQKGNVAWRHAGPFEETSYHALAVQLRKMASAQ